MSNDDLTKHDLEKTLEAHAKAIELQILISQQQNRLLEKLDCCEKEIRKVEGHFMNGFRSEIKEHTHQEMSGVKEAINKMQGQIEEIDRRSWQQMWIWGGIALFTLLNSISFVIGLLK